MARGVYAVWAWMLDFEATTLERVWDGVEDYARKDWRTPEQLHAHLNGWLARHDLEASSEDMHVNCMHGCLADP